MMERITFFQLLPFLLACLFFSCKEKKEIIPGISSALAVERNAVIRNLRYDLSLDIPEKKIDSISGSIVISFDLTNTGPFLLLDFSGPTENIRSLKINDLSAKIVHVNEHLVIHQSDLTDGENSLSIEFIAGDKALNRNDDYLYSLFVPARASSAFPCFDQPDLKAIYKLSLSIPPDWVAFSNGKLAQMDSAGNSRDLRFEDSRPMSTYQFAFGAGKFFHAIDPESGMTMYYRETDTAKVARNLPAIFRLHRQSLEWLKEYAGIPYPYDKFDFALMPAFQFGGMEHPGSIFYRERSLFLEPSASVNEEMQRAGLIAHETAHMWFGNLVTMKWFNDVWLKEVFSNFMAARIVDPMFPQVNHDLRFLLAHYPSAYDVDRSSGTHPIQQELDNLKNAGSVYGAIIYQKAPIVMRNMESLMGQNNFKEGIRDYLKRFSYGNATWDDLIDVLQKHTDKDLDFWNKSWIKTAGMPEIEHVPLPEDRSVMVIQKENPGKSTWPQFFDDLIIAEGKESIHHVEVRKNEKAVIKNDQKGDFQLIINYKGKGYGYFLADTTLLESMLNYAHTSKDPTARAGIWMNCWETFLHGEEDPFYLFEKLVRAINLETDPLLLEYLTDKSQRIFWQFLTPPQRMQVSDNLDEIIFERLALEQEKSLKRILFTFYRNTAMSTEGVSNLKKIWNDEMTLGLELSERDHIQLAYALAVRQVEGSEYILVNQLKRITNPDRRAEVEFIIPSLAADSIIRNEFVKRLDDKENRSHEPWVQEALRYIHHPLRAGQSVKHIRHSLDLLPEIQQTGDIFFPKGWLDAILGEYQSAQAAEIVRKFLKDHPDLPQHLKNKLLQSSDMLFRAEQILKKQTANDSNR